ncbi:MAG TPA: alpha/beta hydrolase [Mycobacteriales bacterium]|nr:alpha/beta hydrolase [Mycobacteriales bacterium]
MTSDEVLRLPDGRQLQFWTGGASDGHPVVVLPGCPDCRRIAFSGDAAAVEAGVRLVAVNRPGYGASDSMPSNHVTVADDVISLADALGLDRFATLGMSLGGPYALACAARHPDRVRAVGMIASPAETTALDPPLPRDGMNTEEQELFRRLASVEAAEAVELLRPGYADWVAGIAPDDPDVDALATRWLDAMSPADRATLARFPADVLAAAARETLAQPDGYLRDVAVTFRRWEFDPSAVTCPVWLMYGADDGNVSMRNAEWLAANLAGATIEILPGTTHLQALLDNWDRAFAALGLGQGPG